MSGVSFNFPRGGIHPYTSGSGLNIDGRIKGQDEINALDLVLKSVFPRSTASFRSTVISDMASGAYTTKATTPGINAVMVQLMHELREGIATPENREARQWFIQEISAANPGKSLEDIYTEVCALRYSFLTGQRDTQPYENPLLPRISSTLYQWEYFPTFTNNLLNPALKNPELSAIYTKVVSRQPLRLPELRLLLVVALQEKMHIENLPNGRAQYPTRLGKLNELLRMIQNITLLSPEQIIQFSKD
jgi:hypothetical protein